MFYTYLLQSLKDKRWYTGCTNDLRKRFKEHNENKVPATRGRGPFELIYYEACMNAQDAYARPVRSPAMPNDFQYHVKRSGFALHNLGGNTLTLTSNGAREKYLKSVSGKRYLKNRLKRFLNLSLTGAGIFLIIFILTIDTARAGAVINKAPISLGLISGLVGYWSFYPVRGKTPSPITASSNGARASAAPSARASNGVDGPPH